VSKGSPLTASKNRISGLMLANHTRYLDSALSLSIPLMHTLVFVTCSCAACRNTRNSYGEKLSLISMNNTASLR